MLHWCNCADHSITSFFWFTNTGWHDSNKQKRWNYVNRSCMPQLDDNHSLYRHGWHTASTSLAMCSTGWVYTKANLLITRKAESCIEYAAMCTEMLCNNASWLHVSGMHESQWQPAEWGTLKSHFTRHKHCRCQHCSTLFVRFRVLWGSLTRTTSGIQNLLASPCELCMHWHKDKKCC